MKVNSKAVKEILNSISPVTLVAATKYVGVNEINELEALGCLIYGENRVQAFLDKYEKYHGKGRWHFIGTLQTNKVKYIAPFVSLIESLDSERLAEEIERQGSRFDRVIDCLLEIHLTQEDSKSGWEYSSLLEFIEQGSFNAMPHIRVRGVMGMATLTDDEATVRADFQRLAQYFKTLKVYFGEAFDTISMGMSDDYHIALEYGSTEVRIGSTIFGSR